MVRDYQACVGSLMYLSVLTRGDCSFAINQTACFLNNPGQTHIAAVKRILRYVAETSSLGLTYRKSADNQEANKLNSWESKRQPVTTISITNLEFYSVSQCVLECVYLRRLMEQI